MQYWLLLLHAGVTCFMCGLIWLVQVVHYPLFAQVGRAEFAEYQRRHMQRTSWVVAAPMCLEGVTAVALLIWPPVGVSLVWLWVSFVALIAIWASTFFLQVPRHEELLRAFDSAVHQFLVRSNWLRTLLWSARALLVLFLIHKALPQ
jgi:hypothetical protein